MADKKGYFELYQQYKKTMSVAQARLRAMTESGTNPGKMSRDDLAAAREDAKGPARDWVGNLKNKVKKVQAKEQAKTAATIAEQQDELLRKNVPADAYKRYSRRGE